jgi:hypothetical protein
MIRILFATVGLLFAMNAGAQTIRGPGAGWEAYRSPSHRWMMPPNSLHMLDRADQASNITEEQFHQIVNDTMKIWVPIAAARGIKLVVDADWSDSTVNASAQQMGKTWQVNMYGGLARRPEVTPDGFALVVCHELGHHFAGYAFYDNRGWASTEGESDYFATNVCAKQIWARDFRGNESWRRVRNIPPSVATKCAQAWPNNFNAQGWCVRAAGAGYSLAHLLSALGGDKAPNFDTPDPTVVKQTVGSHPNGQCRLDTYWAGALCTKTFDINVIPGKDHPKGQNSKEAEMDSMRMTCYAKEGFTMGTRPSCWFKALN